MLHKSIKNLENELNTNLLIVASASRSDIAVDLDELSAKLVRELYQEDQDYTLLLLGGGGTIGFADSLRRALGEYKVIVGDRIWGALSMLSICASELLMSRHGAVGAFDTGLFWAPEALIDGLVYDDIPALGGLNTEHDPTMPGRVAQLKNFQRRAKIWVEANAKEFDLERLKSASLGADTGLSSAQLSELGFKTSPHKSDALEALTKVLDEKLGNKTMPLLRYSESDLADEVEFEFASQVPGAIISTSEACYTYDLDTGNPNPDTGQFVGGWSKTTF